MDRKGPRWVTAGEYYGILIDTYEVDVRCSFFQCIVDSIPRNDFLRFVLLEYISLFSV